MPVSSLNLVNDSLFSVEAPSEEVDSLPAVLARLTRGEALVFPRLRAHQRQAWHQFLVQLAVLALDRDGAAEMPDRAEDWRALLLALTGDAGEPWALVVDDLTRPAFLQPPIPEGTLDGFKGPVPTPDGIDVLITAKNHDVKGARIAHAAPEHWVHALLTLQTQQGFLGAGNYGVSRMNGGFASRPLFAVSPGIDPATRFRRDVAAWQAVFDGRTGPGLLWLEPWDDGRPYAVEQIHPAYVEVCRRVRLTGETGSIAAWTRPTKAARVAAKELKGVVGDPWIPVHRTEAAALTVPARGLHYTKLCEVLWGDERGRVYDWPACMAVLPGEKGRALRLIAQVLVRGQGKTEGLHERILPVPAPAARILFRAPADFGALAKRQMIAADALLRVLRQAVCVFAQGAPAKPDFTDGTAEVWRARFDRAIDDAFFDNLWAAVPEGDGPLDVDGAVLRWERFLRDTGRTLLGQAMDGLPTVTARRYRAIASAEAVFEGGWRKHLDTLKMHETDDGREDAA